MKWGQIMSVRDNMRKKSNKVWNGAKYAGVGFEFGLSIALCTYVGSYIDRSFDSEPLGVAVGVFFGFAVGLRGLMKIAKKEQARFEQLKNTFWRLQQTSKCILNFIYY